MLDPASADGQAILQQVGVSYDDVVFYVSSNFVGKQVRGRVLPSPVQRGAWARRLTRYRDPAPHRVHHVYDTRPPQFPVRLSLGRISYQATLRSKT